MQPSCRLDIQRLFSLWYAINECSGKTAWTCRSLEHALVMLSNMSQTGSQISYLPSVCCKKPKNYILLPKGIPENLFIWNIVVESTPLISKEQMMYELIWLCCCAVLFAPDKNWYMYHFLLRKRVLFRNFISYCSVQSVKEVSPFFPATGDLCCLFDNICKQFEPRSGPT